MLSSAIIVFREVLEAALVVGIVYAASRGVAGRSRWILGGIAAGLAGAGIVALLADSIANAVEGIGQELFNASVLLSATVMLGWHNVWMERHGRAIAQHVKRVGEAVRAGSIPLYTLAAVVAVAILREGSEVVLFLYGLVAGGAGGLVAGGLLGLAAGAVAGVLIYFGLLGIPQRYLFSVTGALILLLAAGLAGQAAVYLVQADLAPSLGAPLWDTSRILSERSLFGETLKILVGYDDRPMPIQAVFYLTALTLIAGARYAFRRPASRTVAASAAIALLAGAVLSPQPVFADHKVYSPIVEAGEAEVEFRGHHDFDGDDAIDGGEKLKATIGYGLTDHWFSEIVFEYEADATGGSRITAYAWENVLQLTEQGRYRADWGLLVEYVAERDGPDKLEFGPLVAHQSGDLLLNTNLIFEREIGGGASTEFEVGYRGDLRRHGNRYFEPGIQVYGELGDLNYLTLDTRHQVGPAFFGVLNHDRGHWRYDAALLFGVTDASPDASVRFQLEYEWYP